MIRLGYEGVKPATVQERPVGDPLRLRAELLLTVVGQPLFQQFNAVYIRGQWYSTLIDTALNASGSVAVNAYPVMGATAVNENPGSWFYRNIWSPLGSALSDPRMALFGVLDGQSFGVFSWATDKLDITDSASWSDDEKAAFGAGSVVGMVGSAILIGGGALAARGAAGLVGLASARAATAVRGAATALAGSQGVRQGPPP